MPDERRYDEDTIREIFRQAAEAQNAAKDSAFGSGLTLDELQEIGAEAGLSPEFIRRAAERLETQVRTEDAPRFMGLNIGVARTVDLPGPMSDEDWHALVGDLRHTFRAKGKIHESGAFREWSNGNLHIMVEPAGGGQRLRMRTLKGSARELMIAGAALSTMSLVGMLILLISVDAGASFRGLATLPILLAGLAMAGTAALQIPSWSRTRGQQMEDIGRRAVERMAGPESVPLRAAERAEPAIDLDEAAGEYDTVARSAGRVRG